MCNKLIDHQENNNQPGFLAMGTSSTASPSVSSPATNPNDESHRVKFLCSFLGSILPRPQDGKLRYVGGETRIVSVPRDINYEDLMSRMRELYEGAAILKYQQPDEDLDALVSVVNDDDVINMMEEYDKLGSGDGFTRLRIFLFSHPDQDGSSHFVDGDERETERRYVDALNNLNDGFDFRKILQPESPRLNHMDDVRAAEHMFNTMTVEGGLHTQRSGEIPISQYNLHNLTIPRISSGQFLPTVTQRFGEPDDTWSPAYYSPRHLPSSPSSAQYRMPLGDVLDKGLDRMPEEYVRQPQVLENVAWMTAGAIPSDCRGGFPGNVFHGTSVYEGNSICENCWNTFQKNQQQFDQPNMVNGLHPVPGHCAECLPNREAFTLNLDPKLHHVVYPKDRNDPRSIYNENYGQERAWMLKHQMNPSRVEEVRTHISSGAGRLKDPYVLDGGVMNFPVGHHGNLGDGHQISSMNSQHRTGAELSGDGFHDQTLVGHPHLHIHSGEECGFQYGNYPYAQGADTLFMASHGHVHPHQSLWKNVANHVPSPSAYEASGIPHPVNGAVSQGFHRIPAEGTPRISVGMEHQTPWLEPSQRVMPFDGPSTRDHSYVLSPRVQDGSCRVAPDSVRHQHENLFIRNEPAKVLDPPSGLVHNNFDAQFIRTEAIKSTGNNQEELKSFRNQESNYTETVESSDVKAVSRMEKPELPHQEAIVSNCLRPVNGGGNGKLGETNTSACHKDGEPSAEQLSFLPDLIASVKKAALEGVEEVKAQAQEEDEAAKDESLHKSEQVNAQCELELDSDSDNPNNYKIEPTKAEAEAIARGLQTIRNDDLEEIRELGSGTYGAVYHGKWKGSDVAIKRIKASCFAGRPSERERLIADFWKEALTLSSLHHPNVVSFYGIVRDGPDGSLATVTEFMVNGSLKQFLQKKDRTIDRRKRLIIAMDAAFGMEYLHGKNIVHFDLKCENLLVNMRDPQRPVCKIGDLGLSKMKQQTLVSGGVRGTLPWMAPELLSGKSNMVTEKIDVYSFGIVMWELLTGEEPYADMHCASIIGGIVNNTLRPKVPPWCDPEWKSLMESCWALDPAERPSFSEISQKLRNMAAAMNVK